MSMIRDLRAVVRPVRLRERRRPCASVHHSTLGTPLPSAVVDCAVYRDGRRLSTEVTPGAALRRVREGDGREFVWIGLHEPSEAEFADIAEEFGLHPLAVEDAVQAHQRPKMERYDDSLFTVFKTVHYVNRVVTSRGGTEVERSRSQVVETGEVMCFTGPHYVITVRHGAQGSLRALRHRLEQDPERLAKGPSAVLHAVADQVVDGYLRVADAVQEDIDEVEIDVFSQPGAQGRRGGDAGRIYQLKREVLGFKRAVSPLLRPMQQLGERPMRVVEPDIQKYFRDVADHLARVNEQVLSFDDLLNSILQANLAQATVAQNEDMRKITAWAAIFAVPTMIAGVYGMNFEVMPETKWTYGYPMVMTFIAVLCLSIHRGFKRNGWL